MNLPKFLLVLLMMFTLGATAQAQQRGGVRGDSPAAQDPLALIQLLGDRLNRVASTGTAWWTNTALLTRLGITEDQKARIERTFEIHRPNLESARAALEKEEAQLAQFLQAEPFDRNAALTQTYRVIQARSDLERENSLMTLEMREVLTRAQWMQLPQPSVGISYFYNGGRYLIREGAGGRGARGQQ
jgi:Spy/CpxP family protein refolding chaperone